MLSFYCFFIALCIFSPVLGDLPTEDQKASILADHNDVRKNTNPGLADLQWSDELANGANDWASQCTWDHSGTPDVGENMYVTANKDAFDQVYTYAISAWADEKGMFNPDTNSCNPGTDCGHYTQVVSEKTTEVGCAAQDCAAISGIPDFVNGGILMVCQYKPS